MYLVMYCGDKVLGPFNGVCPFHSFHYRKDLQSTLSHNVNDVNNLYSCVWNLFVYSLFHNVLLKQWNVVGYNKVCMWLGWRRQDRLAFGVDFFFGSSVHFLAMASLLGFWNSNGVLQGRVVNPTSNPQLWGPKYYIRVYFPRDMLCLAPPLRPVWLDVPCW